MELTQEIQEYLDSHRQEAFELMLTLAQIPAPSNQEQARADFCAQWLCQQGADSVYVDDALNVVYPIACSEHNDIVVFMAHSDVVFPDTTPLPLSVSDGKIHCPGVGDDTANVVALLMAAKYITAKKLSPRHVGLLLVVNSGEEGLGNLKGCRKIMEDYAGRIQEFVTFDGTAREIINKAVGSRRYRISVETEGGHSYGKFGNPNAIACLASLIDELYQVEVPSVGKTTYNVGTITGGTSVNTIAQHAEMLYEFRSDERKGMEIMEHNLQNILQKHLARGIDFSVTLMGDRPCSGDINAELEDAMILRAQSAISRHYGFQPICRSGSTDCNIPLSLGIPSICVGCLEGDGAHTREEYVEISSLRPGLGVAMELILHHF